MSGDRLTMVTTPVDPGTPWRLGERDPTAADIVAWLQARPDVAVEVLGEARVAGPWSLPYGERGGCGRYILRRSPAALVWVSDGPLHTNEWHWESVSKTGWAPSRDAAMAAADAALVAQGWALAGGRRG